MLHILFNSPFKTDVKTMSLMLLPQDIVIALQDGVLFALNKVNILKKFFRHSLKCYILKKDVYIRGLFNHISSNFILIDYSQFVLLTQKYSKYVIW